MNDARGLDEIELARLVSALPDAPEGWIQAAALLPFVDDDLETLGERCREDAELRARVIASLEAALASTHEPTRRRAGDVDARLRDDERR